MRDRAGLDELGSLPAELAVGLRELALLLEVLDALARLLDDDVRRLFQRSKNFLLLALFCHRPDATRTRAAAAARRCACRSIEARARSCTSRRRSSSGGSGGSPGSGSGRRLVGARLRELLLQLLGRVGRGRGGCGLRRRRRKSQASPMANPIPARKRPIRCPMLLFRGLLASHRAACSRPALRHARPIQTAGRRNEGT